MVQNDTPKKYLTAALRQPILEASMLDGLAIAQIAKRCGVQPGTIKRDIRKWKESGDYDVWVTRELLRLHKQECQKEGGGKAYQIIADLFKRRLKEQVEISGTTNIIVKAWDLGNVKGDEK